MTPHDSVTVRRAGPHDLAFVTQDGYAREGHAAHLIASGDVWVAELGGRPAGYVRVEQLWGRVPYVALIRVLPDARGRGAGRALLQAVASDLAARGCDALYSSSQADEPEPQTWHRHMGFRECGFLAGINEGGIGEVFFRLPLQP